MHEYKASHDDGVGALCEINGPVSVLDEVGASKGADHAILILAPGLERELHVLGVIVDVVVVQKNGLGAIFWIRPELLIHAVLCRLVIDDSDAMLRRKIFRHRCLVIIPDDMQFQE